LDRYRAQIDTTLLVSLTTTVRAELQKERSWLKSSGPDEQSSIRGTEETKRWAADLIEAIQEHHWQSQNQQDMASFSSYVSSKTEAQREELAQARILEKLRFNDMGDRYERIEDAHRRTFEWVFEDQDKEVFVESDRSTRAQSSGGEYLAAEGNSPRWDNFSSWLRGDTGLYWITGKPGSGKSTLMKYLYNERKTLKYLHQWSKDKSLVTAGFFLWNSGTAMQMSKMGLLQALLHESIKSRTALVPVLFPDRWRSYVLFGGDVHPWSWSELSRAFDILISDNSTNFFFFIDGLDEFDGDCAELANFALGKSTKPNVKICVASRPWLIFEDAFQRQPSLRLEDLTTKDIQLFVSEKLRDNSMFLYLENLETEEANTLIVEVTGKASGVFLWVRLVVLSLLEGLRNGDTIGDLYERLQLLPSNLEQLFMKILNSLDPLYLEQASKLFQYVRAARQPLSLLSLSFAEDGFENAMNAPIKPLTVGESNFKAETMRRRLTSRCKGLIEAPTHKDAGSSAKVQYLHRTVKDFLNSPKIWDYIKSGAPDSFSPNLMLCGAFLQEIKSMTKQKGTLSIFKVLLKEFIEYSITLEGNIHIASLRELDRAAETLLQGSRGFYGKALRKDEASHWSALLPGHGIPPSKSFFDYAFKYPLHSFVENELDAGYSSNSQINGVPLLFRAAELDDVLMMRILLEHEADPNWQQSRGLTAWYQALVCISNNAKRQKEYYYASKYILPPSGNQPEGLENRAGLIQAFIEHNADPGIFVGGKPVGSLIEKAFGRWDRKRTNMLLELWAASKDNWKEPKSKTPDHNKPYPERPAHNKSAHEYVNYGRMDLDTLGDSKRDYNMPMRNKPDNYNSDYEKSFHDDPDRAGSATIPEVSIRYRYGIDTG
jgi:hypothetical protein